MKASTLEEAHKFYKLFLDCDLESVPQQVSSSGLMLIVEFFEPIYILCFKLFFLNNLSK